jgi:oligoribonuclease NrnB/cAMP/cGMP phosphodiesterase (DHH superfamily)
MLIIYHKIDFDGQCSGAIVKHKYPDAELYGMNYSDPFPWHKLVIHEEVVMVDFSLQPFTEMERLNNNCDLTWIDHHKTAIKDSVDLGLSGIKGERLVGFAACELTWGYYHPQAVMPRAVYLLGRYDIWDHTCPDTVPFQYGLRLNPDTKPDSPVWPMLFDPVVCDTIIAATISVGKTILQYEAQQNAAICRYSSFETLIHGYRVITVNAALSGSMVFDSIYDPARHDAMCIFSYSRRGDWRLSFYSTKPEVDVSALAKEFGGGGHAGAAGCHVDDISFIFKSRVNEIAPLKRDESVK